MRIIFFGTPAFAIPSLAALLQSEEEVIAVVTQPDKKKEEVVYPPLHQLKNLLLIEELRFYSQLI